MLRINSFKLRFDSKPLISACVHMGSLLLNILCCIINMAENAVHDAGGLQQQASLNGFLKSR